jgi:hypothetical protein
MVYESYLHYILATDIVIGLAVSVPEMDRLFWFSP